jgi:hypothetical protein
MNDIICLIYKWQTLIGAFLGGLFALFVALIVAYKSRRYDETVSAMILIPDLLHIYAAQAIIEETAEESKVSETDRDILMAAKLISFRPELSPLYESSMSRVMPIHPALAAHLNFVIKIYSSVEKRLRKIEDNIQHHEKTGDYLIERTEINFMVKRIRDDMLIISKHAMCANNLLHKLVTSRISFLYRVWYSLKTPFGSGECGELLKTGKV